MVVPATVNAASDPTLVRDDVTTVLFSVVPLNVDALATLDVKAYDAEVANDDVSGVNVIDVAADDVVANDDVSGVNVIDVAADAVVANDAEIAVLASPINDPVKLPVLICTELLTTPDGSMVGANDADVILPLKLPVLICKELLTIPDGNIVGANDADVILPLKLPVLI